MKIRPTRNWKLLGTSIEMSTDNVYNAVNATNQPDWERCGKVFAIIGEDSMMLEKGDYTIVK